MEKSDKRAFKLYISRSRNREELKVVKLFDAIDKQQQYNEEDLLKKVPEISKSQLSNAKAHLYRQILASLRVLQTPHNIDMQIREVLDYTRILYNKGLYQQGLKILEKAKQQAMTSNRNHLYLEILEFEKVIEAQFITRSIEDRAEMLTNEVNFVLDVVKTTHSYSNLALRLYGLYIKIGHVKNKKEDTSVREFFKSSLPSEMPSVKSFSEQLFYHQAHAWYYYIIQDFRGYYKHSNKWVRLFEVFPEMKVYETTWYFKGLHNLLTSLFIIGRYRQFKEVLMQFEQFREERYDGLSENLRIVSFLYIYNAKINRYLMDGTFKKGLYLVDEIEKNLKSSGGKIDDHRFLLFYYKIACLYFGCGDNENSLKYLNKIIDYKDVGLREDIHCFSRILSLIIHYELGDENKLEYQVKSVYHFLGRMNDINEVQKEIFKFLKRAGSIYPQDIKKEFQDLLVTFEKLQETPYEKRPFFYLDIVSWLKSKIENTTIQQVIRDRFLESKEAETKDLPQGRK
jgi:hypothetical protein